EEHRERNGKEDAVPVDDREVQDSLRVLVLQEREVMKDVLVRARWLFCGHYFCSLNVGSAFASATQNTRKVAIYAPSIASGTTFIVFNTTTNSTITTATLAASPAKNACSARRGSVPARLPNPTSAIARLAALLIPPPSSAEIAA